jgi:predicted ATPase
MSGYFFLNVALSTEHGFAQWAALGTFLQGWALVAQGQDETGVAQMRQSFAAYRATGAGNWRPYALALLAGAYGKVEQAEDGLAVLAEALTVAHKTEERTWEAELHRLKGELTLQSRVESLESGAQKEAEECFRQAIKVARGQRAKSLELRATMSLSRLWHIQGKKDEAREMLAEIYSWFTEGFDTADLQEAKALLEELSA